MYTEGQAFQLDSGYYSLANGYCTLVGNKLQRERDIQEHMNKLHPVIVYMGGEAVNPDIEAYIVSMLETDEKLNKLDALLQEMIRDRLMQKAQGM
jgi:NADH:ubiquinone oxidoreductase subunit B-like Fe-S oxidoreductase